MTDSMWQYTQGEVVLTVPQIMARNIVEDVIVHGREIPDPQNMMHIPLSKVDYAITRREWERDYAEFVIGGKSFYVIGSPDVREALQNTMFANVFSGDGE